jgi:hypothetical protein
VGGPTKCMRIQKNRRSLKALRHIMKAMWSDVLSTLKWTLKNKCPHLLPIKKRSPNTERKSGPYTWLPLLRSKTLYSTGVMAQMVEHPPSKHQALSSNSRATKDTRPLLRIEYCLTTHIIQCWRTLQALPSLWNL